MARARKFLLPRVTLTQVVEGDDPGAVLVSECPEPYYVAPLLVPSQEIRRDGRPTWAKHQFNLLPIVVDGTGAVWAEATIYLLARIESQIAPNMASYSSIADDLAAYRRFLDDYDLDWTDFPQPKLNRPTYRFNGHLKFAIAAGEISASTARRRMTSVIGFYRWLIDAQAISPAHAPWKEADRYINFSDSKGFRRLKQVHSTDLSVRVPQQRDPYDGLIDDGGKLRPLSDSEQEWVVDALRSIGNTEMTLIFLMSLLSAARIQTVLTTRVRHALIAFDPSSESEVRIPVGPGTGVDTKYNKRMVLHIPTWFYSRLQSYAQSERSRLRRQKARGGDGQDQFLFLSNRGVPFYDSRDRLQLFDDGNRLRHRKSGQAVRQFITERVIPVIREKRSVPRFRFKFHDLRATAGMNWTDAQLSFVTRGEISLHEAREFVRTRMGHESSGVTDRYLQYRHSVEMVRRVEERHEAHLRHLIMCALEG